MGVALGPKLLGLNSKLQAWRSKYKTQTWHVKFTLLPISCMVMMGLVIRTVIVDSGIGGRLVVTSGGTPGIHYAVSNRYRTLRDEINASL